MCRHVDGLEHDEHAARTVAGCRHSARVRPVCVVEERDDDVGVVGETNACVVLAGKATVPEEVIVVATEAPDDGAILAGDAVEGVRMPGTDEVVAIGEFID